MRGDKNLQAFSDELRNGYKMLKAMNCLGEVSVQSHLAKIVNRLPAYLQNRWRREASKIKREQGRLPDFHDVVEFVEEAADEANDPIFGGTAKVQTVEHQPPPCNKPKRASASNTTASRGKVKCYNCGENHSIYTCQHFRRMTPAERNRAVQQKKLCLNCLRGNHTAEKNRRRRRCHR